MTGPAFPPSAEFTITIPEDCTSLRTTQGPATSYDR